MLDSKITCYVIGSGGLLINCVKHLIVNGDQVQGIISSDEEVKKFAAENNINVTPYYELDNLTEEIRTCDYFFSIINPMPLSDECILLPNKFSINFHDAPLPYYAGLNATSWAILNNETMHGVTWHVMDSQIDAGDILQQIHFPIVAGETALSLNLKCYSYGFEAFKKLTQDLRKGTISPVKQNLSERTYFSGVKKPEYWGFVYWEDSALKIEKLFRALYFGPYPNTVTPFKVFVKKSAYIVKKLSILNARSMKPPGSIIKINSEGFEVATGTYDIYLSDFYDLDGKCCSMGGLVQKEEIVLGDILITINKDQAKQLALSNKNWESSGISGALTQEEKCKIEKWNHTFKSFPENLTVMDFFEMQVKKTPNNIAVEFEDQKLSYQELNNKSNQLARYLQAQNVGPEVLVGLCLEPSIPMLIAIYAILKAGAAYVPLEPHLPEDRLKYIIEDAGLSLVLTEKRIVDCLHTIEKYPSENLSEKINPEHPAYVIYTSGSTGRPKGVMILHKSLSNLLQSEPYYSFKENERFILKTSFSFDASIPEIFSWFFNGGQVVIAPAGIEKEPTELLQFIEQHQITRIMLTPSLLQGLLYSNKMVLKSALRFLKTIFIGGEALDASLAASLFDVLADKTQVINVYGPTEATVDSAYYRLDRNKKDYWRNLIPIGKPISNLQLYILDARQHPVHISVPGELYISGVQLAKHYLNRPDLTEASFLPNPFSEDPHARMYKTGDLCFWLPDGNIQYIGRIDSQVKIRGFRVEPREIEFIFRSHPSVRDVVVLVREQKPTNNQIVAYYILEKKGLLSAETLREFLKKHLSEYMIPSFFVELDHFPLTSNGKLDQKNLLSMNLLNERDNPFCRYHPADPIEYDLMKIWIKVLNEEPTMTGNFFMMGGDSLSLVQLTSEINHHFSLNLPFSWCYLYPSIESQAKQIRSQSNHMIEYSPLITFNSEGSGYPLFMVHPGDASSAYEYLNLAKILGKNQSCYGIESYNLLNSQKPINSLEQLASFYLSQIKKIQSTGPYHFLGWSTGGIIAYEMSQQLIRQGEKVNKIFMIDSLALNQDDVSLLKKANLSIEGMTNHMLKLINMPLEFKERFYRVLKVEYEALLNYKIETYAGEVILFKAKKLSSMLSGNVKIDNIYREKQKDPTNGWGPFVNKLNAQVIIDDHYWVMSEHENLSKMAEIIHDAMSISNC